MCGRWVSNVAHKGANDLVVAYAAMQPAQEQHELHANRNERGQDGVPVRGHGTILKRWGRGCRGAACGAPTRNMKAAASRRTPKLEKRAGHTAERATESRPDRGKESPAAARGVGARVEQFRGDAERSPEQIRVHAEEARKALQRGHLALKSGVGKGELVLLRLACRGNSLLARELVGEIGKAGGIARACQTVLRRLLQRIECAGQRALRLPGHRGFVSGAQTGIVQDALKLREE